MTYEKLVNYMKLVSDKLITVDADQADKLYKTLDIGVTEQIGYFELNARMFASGKIDLATSNFVYQSLRAWEKTTLTQRIAITQLLSELAKMRIQERSQ